MILRFLSALLLAVSISAIAFAQSPNTAAISVTVVDQSGAVVNGAKIKVKNSAISLERDTVSAGDGTATVAALPLTGSYGISVEMAGFAPEEVKDIQLRSGEIAAVKIKLVASGGRNEITVYGTASGVRNDAQIGRSIDSPRLDETPILGRKITSVPLLNSAFRQAKGTGDLFVNATYFVTGVGGRRQTTTTLDGANNDEAWGRQVAITTVPIGAVQEMTVLSNAFSSEFGWTAGPALNIVTKSGTNLFHGEGMFLGRPGDWQAKTFSTKNFCPASVATCVTPTTLLAVNPVDIPDSLKQFSGSFGGPIIKDRTFFFATVDRTMQDRTTFLSTSLPSFLLPADGHLDVTGHYRQTLANIRVDHKITDNHSLMLRWNMDRFYDDNPQDAVGGTNAPSVARKYSRATLAGQANLTSVLTPSLLNEFRFAYLNGDPVTKWEAGTLSTTYSRSGSVPFTIGQSRLSDLYGHQVQFSDTLTWTKGIHYLRFGGNLMHHTSGGTGSEPGTAVLGTFTFKNTTTLPFDQLTLADVQNYTQPINFGISSYELSQWLITGFVQDSIKIHRDFTLDVGVRYDRQTLTTATRNFAPRAGFGWRPFGSSRFSVRGGYGMYYTQVRSNTVAAYLVGGLDGLTTYTATPGQLGFPTCLTGSCLPLNFDPKTLLPSQLPARDITIRAGQRDFYKAQFTRYGLNFDLLPNYPDTFVNPRSQVGTIGVEKEFFKGFFVAADYVKQHLTNLDRTVDLNAPSAFDRTAPGQTRTVAAANATRPILPVNGGVRQVNVLTNLGIADYDGLQTQISYRGNSKIYASLSYTLSKATSTSEVDGNGIAPNDSALSRLGEEERGPSVLDQRHRAVVTFAYHFPWSITAGTLMSFASARPFNATTGVDNNGDGLNNDRPVINGAVIGKSAFRGSMTSDVSIYIQSKIKVTERAHLLLRLEGFNIRNHGNYLGRGVTIYGDTGTAASTFGQVVAVGTATNALPAFANVDPPRMYQLQARFVF